MKNLSLLGLVASHGRVGTANPSFLLLPVWYSMLCTTVAFSSQYSKRLMKEFSFFSKVTATIQRGTCVSRVEGVTPTPTNVEMPCVVATRDCSAHQSGTRHLFCHCNLSTASFVVLPVPVPHYPFHHAMATSNCYHVCARRLIYSTLTIVLWLPTPTASVCKSMRQTWYIESREISSATSPSY